MTHNMDIDQYNIDLCEIQKFMHTEIQHRFMRRRLKYGHSYQTYNVYLCQMDTNLSTTMTIQMWIRARTYTKYSITTWGKKCALNKYPGSSSRLPQSTILSM